MSKHTARFNLHGRPGFAGNRVVMCICMDTAVHSPCAAGIRTAKGGFSLLTSVITSHPIGRLLLWAHTNAP